MKTYIKYLILFGFAIVSACKKDSMPAASEPVSDPYARLDNATNDVDHQIFLIYQQTKTPVLYGDTLSKSPLNLLNINYQISGFSSKVVVKYLKKKTDLLAGVAFIKDQILPPLGPVKVHSFLLTDTLMINNFGVNTYYNTFQGISALAIANIPRIGTMSPSAFKLYKAEILRTPLIAPLNTGNILKDFYAVSATFYNKSFSSGQTGTTYLTSADKQVYGFILDGKEFSTYYAAVDQTADLNLFLMKALSMTTAEFQAQYKTYPLIMNKYNLLKAALVNVGFDFTKL